MKKNRVFFCIVFFFFWGNNNSFSQVERDFKGILFGDIQKQKSTLISIEKTKSDDLLYVQRKNNFFPLFSIRKSRYSFDIANDFTIPKGKFIKLKGNKNNSQLIGYTQLGNSTLALSYYSSFFHSSPSFYYHFINPKLKEKVNYGFPIFNFNLRNSKIDLSRVVMISSDNDNYAAILYFPITKSDEYATVKYAIFKNEFTSPIESEFLFPYSSNDYEPLEFLILNEKEQLLFSGHYSKMEFDLNKRTTKPYFESIIISKISDSNLVQNEIRKTGYFFTDIAVLYEESETVITGLYTQNMFGNIDGVFLGRIDKEGNVLNKTFTPFPTNFKLLINDLHGESALNQSYPQVESSKYTILDLKKVDSGYVCVAEFNAIEYRYGGSDMPGTINIVDTYYWSGNIIVSKIDFKGNLVWFDIIPKLQRTINDGGLYLSTATYISKEYIHLFFNDNLNNYNKKGDYTNFSNQQELTKFGATKNTIAHISINLSSGALLRKNTIGRAETEVLFIPEFSIPLELQNKLVIYGKGRKKQRLGNINFKTIK